MTPRHAFSILLPVVALGIQWVLWSWIQPFVWFLFFPTVFFSARLGGYRGGLASTAISAGIVWYFFIPPQLSWWIDNPANLWSVGLFLFVGYLVSESQARLERARQDTEQALSETRTANEKITELYRKTRELDKVKSQFFANISHELRTPLTLILNPIAGRLAEGGLAPAMQRDLEVVERNARLLYRHVTDLLDVAKLEAGRMTLHMEQVDLAHLTRVMVSNFEVLAREHGIELEIDTPDNLPVRMDVGKVQRILLNLLSNAFKFTPDGGVVRVTLKTSDGKLLLQVMDNGPGVEPSQRETIFEPFRQADGSATRHFGGTGLGLSIVREFVKLHDGTVSVTDAPTGGALFLVSLPLMVDPDSATAGEVTGGNLDPELQRQALEELRPLKDNGAITVVANDAALVLIVEDSSDMGAYLAETLGRYYRVAIARDGREGLERALVLRPDLILTDMMMPGMSGDEMVLALRARSEMADIPIIMLTAKVDEAMQLKLLQSGIQDFLTKPFHPDELLARIGGLLAERRRVNEQLRNSETRFEAAFEQAAVGMAHVAPDGRWLRVNRKLCDIVGYAQDELLSLRFQDITHPDDLAVDLEYVRRMLAMEIQTYTMEKRYIRKNGGIVWINLTVALIRKPDNAPDYFISVVEDITIRKQMEAALRVSEEQLHLFIEHAPAALAMFDRDMRYIAHSRRWIDDYSLGEKNIIGKSHYEIFPELSDRIKSIHRRGMAGEVIRSDQDRFERQDGRVQWLFWEMRPWYNADNGIGGVVIFSEDITEIKQNAEEREMSVEFLQLVNDSMDTAGLIHAATDFFHRKAGCEAVGIRLRREYDYPYYETRGFPQEFVLLENRLCIQDNNGRPVLDSSGSPLLECMCGNVICGRFDPSKSFFSPKGSFWTNCTTELLRNTTEADRQSRTRNRCNGEGYESVALIALRFGEQRLGLLQLNDKRKNRFTPEIIALWERLADYLAVAISRFLAEEAVKTSAAVLQQAQQLAGIGNWSWDVRNDHHTWSEEIYRIYGRDPALPPAVYPEVQQYFTQESWAQLAAAVEKGLSEGLPYECDAEVVRPDGLRRWITARGQATRDADGNIITLHGTVQDITGRKAAEEELRRHRDHLEELVRERTEELEAFAYSVSHDLRSPLRGIDGYSRLLLEDHAKTLDEDGRFMLNQVRESALQMDELIDDLLDFSRMGRREMRFLHCDMDRILQEQFREIRAGYPDRNLRLELQELPACTADPAMLRVVWRNLLDNAVKYSRTREEALIEVGVVRERENAGLNEHGKNPSIEPEVRDSQLELIYFVRDNGVGFDPRYRDKLFKVFQRLHRAEDFKGTGIGLALVQRIIQRHGGRVWAESRPDQGATFYFALPCNIHLE